MKNNITELVFILDRSGSMSGLESDTIGGFNSLIEKQKKVEGECYVTTVLFDHELQRLHDRVKLSEIRPLTEADYSVRGSTALLDAIGDSIRHIVQIHRYVRPEDVPEHTLFVIVTDGLENASHVYSSDRVKEMIQHEKEKYSWEFLFLGANIDAVETAGRMGIGAARAVNYRADSRGTRVLYDAVSATVCSARMKMPIRDNWAEEIQQDFKNR